ncbi:ATP-NAD kinase family protein [Kangiella sp. HZ709]|uniref:ATP-NAD kinase family protein n=1 Tax=Kangiella sp. HZ709 TaxID=2666328 RepID=UPI0012B11785|nr:ATP-NAD kinase family protein [Kangiella sp. HZ709]MRX26536.1 ATP-NAD kinase [Kangiella sp. HZ709]
MDKSTKLRFGLLINPFAGIGGKVGLKGSDGDAIRQEAFDKGAVPQAANRAKLALESVTKYSHLIEWFTVDGAMGGLTLEALGFEYTSVHHANLISEAADTLQAVTEFNQLDLDLILFAGGDGTARNICSVVKTEQVVLGIPAGVKIHSGVYAITPKAAAIVVERMIRNQLVSLIEASVMDIDEDEFRAGTVKAKKYGEMLVPAEYQFIQSTKISSSQLASQNDQQQEVNLQNDIAEYLVEHMEEDIHYLIGSGTSCAAVMNALDLPNSLLGIDWVHQEQLKQSDLTESDILKIIEEHPTKVKIVITIIGGQGHILGRGNHQISANVMSRLKKTDLIIIATKNKISQLNNKPLVVDTDDPLINQKLSGLARVICGYEDEIYYRIGLEA